MAGLIALDIDGTVTDDFGLIPEPVATYLSRLHEEGWRIAFITGRMFSSGMRSLRDLPFPYGLAVQNGATLLSMADQKILDTRYIEDTALPFLEELCRTDPSDYCLFAGVEHGDRCYFRSNHFSPEQLERLRRRCAITEEIWTDVASYDVLPVRRYSSIKCFGFRQPLEELAQRCREQLGLSVPVIRDPILRDEGYYVAQMTHPEATKGYAMERFAELFEVDGPLIAAGDDHNDRCMVERADVGVVMATAPQVLLEKADLVAAPASRHGIIDGLSRAIVMAGER